MNSSGESARCEFAELTSAFAVEVLSARDSDLLQQHIAACLECRLQLGALRDLFSFFVHWPSDVVRPAEDLSTRLAKRMAIETGEEFAAPARRDWEEPEWEDVAPGIRCKVLATDAATDRVSMLVHLDPGVVYPPHVHADVEELHLLDGELWIEDRKLLPGDYNRAERGTKDTRVYSETGCTCVLITSNADVLE